MNNSATKLALVLLFFLLCGAVATVLVVKKAEKRIYKDLLTRAESLAVVFGRQLRTQFADIDLELPSRKRLQLKNQLAAQCITYPHCIAIHLITKRKDGTLIILTSKGRTVAESAKSLGMHHKEIAIAIEKAFSKFEKVFLKSSRKGEKGGIKIFVPVEGKTRGTVRYVLCVIVNYRAIRKQLINQALFPIALSFILVLAIFGGFLVLSRTHVREYSPGKKLFVLFLSITITVATVLGMMYVAHRYLLLREYKTGKSITERIAQKINFSVVYPLKNTARSIARSDLFYDTALGELPPDNEKILISLQTVRADFEASLAYILNRKGTVVACTPYDNGKTLTGKNYAFRPYFIEAMKGRPYFYLALGVTTHRRGIYASSPISKKGTPPVGVFVIKVGLEKIDNIIFSTESIMALLSPEGVIFSTNKPDWLLHVVHSDTTDVRRILKTRQFGLHPLKYLPEEIDFSKRELRIGNRKYIVTRAPVDILNPDGKRWEIVRLRTLGGFTSLLIYSGIVTSFVLFLAQLYLVLRLERSRLLDNINVSKKIQETLIENLSAGVAIIDSATHRIETVNQVAATYFGAPGDEMVGKVCYGYLCPYTEKDCPVDSVDKGPYNEEGIMLRKDGTTMHVIRSIKSIEIAGHVKLVHTFVDITELKKTQEALKESEKNFRTFFESIGDLILVANTSGRILYANKALVKRLGYSIKELSSMHVFDLRPPERRKEAEAACKALFKGKLDRCLIPFMAKDGTQIPVDTRVWLGKWNKVQCIFSVSKDISKEQEALQKFEQLFRNNPVIMALTLLPELRFADVNNAFLEILGYSREELIGKTWHDIEILDREAIDCLEKTLREKKLVSNVEMKMRSRAGDIRFGLFSIRYIKIKGQDSALTVIKDITNLKIAEAHLKASEERLRSITNSVQDAIIMIDSDGKVSFWNPAATHIFGYDSKEAMNRPVADLVIPKSLRNTHIEAVKEFAKTGKGKIFGKLLELKAIRKDGSKIPVSLSCAPVLIHNRWHAVGILRDITDAKKAQERLVRMNTELKRAIARANRMTVKAEAANRAKSIFLANMSHEIRTPLNAILGFAQVLQSDPRFPRDLVTILDIINRSGEHLLALINDILEISKIEAGRITLNLSTFNLQNVLDDLENMFRSKAESKGLDFIIERSDNLPTWIESDRIKLRQILFNLTGNAIKFTTSGYVKISISSEEVGDNENRTLLKFDIEDTGPGISKEDLKDLFKPFTQTAEGAKIGGTGLGLSITQGYLKVMNGSICVKSSPGQGSTFSFQIPVKTFELKTGSALAEETRYVMGVNFENEPPKILVVDDNPGNRKLLGVILERVGFRVKKASDSTEALEIFKTWSPDLVFMDIRMPGMDGYETTKLIKSLNPDVPVIAVTASVFSFSEKKFAEAGLDDCIRKPFRQNEIFDVIRKFLDVQYTLSPAVQMGTAKHPDIAPEDLEKIPKSLLLEMRKALEEGDINRLVRLIEQVDSLNSTLAKTLKTMAQNYDYDRLGKVLHA